MNRIVPRHEPETIKALADKQYRGDDWKVPTTSLKKWMEGRVHIISRYDKADEFETMSAMVRSLPPDLFKITRTVFCDSKTTASYSVTIDPWCSNCAAQIGTSMEQICITIDGGHNGISVSCFNAGSIFGNHDCCIFINPKWCDDP
jgi:hypothetical protein